MPKSQTYFKLLQMFQPTITALVNLFLFCEWLKYLCKIRIYILYFDIWWCSSVWSLSRYKFFSISFVIIPANFLWASQKIILLGVPVNHNNRLMALNFMQLILLELALKTSEIFAQEVRATMQWLAKKMWVYRKRWINLSTYFQFCQICKKNPELFKIRYDYGKS